MAVVPTAIVPPRALRPIIVRQTLARLVEVVDASRVTTVCSPAGSGKTTAMFYWAEELRKKGRPVLWLAARAGISDLASFTAALREAGVAAGLGWGSLRDDAPIEDWLVAVADKPDNRLVLVIDDAQMLSSEIITFVTQVIASARDALTTIIASRGSSRIPIARMRSLGFLVEVTFADLCFSAAEATELFTRIAGGPVDAGDLHHVVLDTQGWAAGLVLAADIYRQEIERNARGAMRLTGLRHEFAEYFYEEVLSQQTDLVRNFLVDTSVLDELTPSSCAAVVGSDDSRAMLDSVYSMGLFLHASDLERSRYQYHTLFREMVIGRMMDRAPARAEELNRRASCYFAAAKQPLVALEYARRSGDQGFLADQLDSLANELTYAGYMYRVDELGSDLPWEILSTRPMLLLCLAWRRTRRLAFASAARLIEAARAAIAQKCANEDVDEFQRNSLDCMVRHRVLMLAAARDDMETVELDSEALLADLGDDHPYLSCSLLAQLMAARRELYHFHDVLKLEAQTRKALGRPDASFASIALKASVAPTLMAQGKTQIAHQLLEEAFELARSFQGDGSGLAALPALPLAELWYECNELARSAELTEAYLPTVRQWGFVDQLASGYLVRARLACARGDVSAALSGLEEAHLIAIECGVDRLRAFVVAEQVRILVKNGHLDQAEAAFAAGDLLLDGEPLPGRNPTRREESVAVAWLRLEMQRHRLVRARKVAKRWLDFVKRSGAVRSAVTFEILLAEIAVLAGDRSEARRSVRAAVEMAEPADWVRVFIDEGEVISALLIEAYAHGPNLDQAADRFADKLVAIMRGAPALETEDEDEYGLCGRLAGREVDILTMVAGGLRNREIGDRLGLTEGTVKWYMQQIYDKLGVRRRPQAVIRARQLGILP